MLFNTNALFANQLPDTPKDKCLELVYRYQIENSLDSNSEKAIKTLRKQTLEFLGKDHLSPLDEAFVQQSARFSELVSSGLIQKVIIDELFIRDVKTKEEVVAYLSELRRNNIQGLIAFTRSISVRVAEFAAAGHRVDAPSPRKP